MVRNIRNMFQRADLTEQEMQTLHGIVHELVTYRRRKGEENRDHLPCSIAATLRRFLSRRLREARPVAS